MAGGAKRGGTWQRGGKGPGGQGAAAEADQEAEAATGRFRAGTGLFRVRVGEIGPVQRMKLVKPGQGLSSRKQCAAVKVPVSSYYCRPKPPSEERRRMTEEAVVPHSEQPSMGARRL